MAAGKECRLEVEERVATSTKGEAGVLTKQKVLVQKKGDEFDAEDYARVMEFTTSHAPTFEHTHRVIVMKEGVPFNHALHSTVKQKLLYNKEKKLLKKIEDALAQKEAEDSLAKFSSSFTRFRVKIPDLVYFSTDIEQQKTALFTLVSEAYEKALEHAAENLGPGQDTIQLKKYRPKRDNMFRLNDQGQLNNYMIIFFDDENLARAFCSALDNKIFNRSVLKPEILPNK